MAISKQITQDATGVVVGYHVVLSVTLDKASKMTTGAVSSFVSADAKSAGKQPVGYPVHITVPGLPGAKEEAFNFFEKQVTAAQPTDGDGGGNPMAVNSFGDVRYVFADGTVVADV
ncbi:hypothetical protein SB778_03510 [Paraburkholderia sp. SIMBA_050]